MNEGVQQVLQTLNGLLCDIGRSAVAVSGGVDSMTLAVVAHRALSPEVEMFHALSPAVPPDATARVRGYAEREGWRLHIINAGEFKDPKYMRNPVNRCFFCKSRLYTTIIGLTQSTVISGTNLDDLHDYRPGLEAARNSQVRNPFVEAGIDKNTVRAIARHLQLVDVAELPAAPCLSSRIETGIRIEPHVLTLIDAVEKQISQQLHPKTVRCRVRKDGVTIELGKDTLVMLSDELKRSLGDQIAAMFRAEGLDQPINFAPYRRGSAFLRHIAHE